MKNGRAGKSLTTAEVTNPLLGGAVGALLARDE
jgi:hypothetical protein